MPAKFLTISALAEQTGHRSSALRYYEDIGLLKPAARVSGRRRYDPDAINQLALIALYQDLGFSLGEIQSLIPHQDVSRPRWETLAYAKVKELEATIRKAQAAKRLLHATIDCQCTRLDGCELVMAAGERRRVHKNARSIRLPSTKRRSETGTRP